MKPRIRVYPYKQGSKSAKSLAEALGGKVLKLEGSKFIPRRGDVIINWGSSSFQSPVQSFNKGSAVRLTGNKLSCLAALREANISIPDFYTNKEEIPNEAYPVVCRTILNGHSGRGIVVASNPDELVDAPLYTRYVKKAAEFRVHIVKGEVILLQRKVRDNRVATEDVNWQIRNHQNGFIFQRNEVQCDPSVTSVAIQAVEALGLDFGAVDIIWNDHQSKAFVLEINTAPGLEGQTISDYSEAFKKVM